MSVGFTQMVCHLVNSFIHFSNLINLIDSVLDVFQPIYFFAFRDISVEIAGLSTICGGGGLLSKFPNLAFCTVMWVSKYIGLLVVELSGDTQSPANRDQYYPDSLLFISAGFLPRVSSQRLN